MESKKEYSVDLGATVYEANKQLVKQTEKPLTHLELAGRQENLTKFFEESGKYVMLLCHEQRDYTVFNLDQNSLTSPLTAAKEVLLCCNNRGEILSIDKTEDDFAFEIWINIDNEPYCYYLFPYNEAVIECA
jgi:hypothetical protein